MKTVKWSICGFLLMLSLMAGCITWPPIPWPPTPDPDPTPTPITNSVIAWDHVIGMGNFLGVCPWKNNSGIFNDAPKDIPTLINQFARAGGTLIQVQLMYEDGAVFTPGKGLQLNNEKVDYCINYRNICSNNGVCVTFVLFDHCSLKSANNWAESPLNSINGGPFSQAYDVYSHFSSVSQYVTDIVTKLNGNNVAWEIINEGTDGNFAGQVRDLLKSLGVTRITTSGSNPGDLWRYSDHNKVTASAVKSDQLPNTDGTTWTIGNVAPICAAIRATPRSGLVFDGVTDAAHNWAEFLKAIKNPNPTPTPAPTPIAITNYCDCDLTLPLCQPPFTAQQLKDAGNSQECPVYQGMDIRFDVRRADKPGESWLIATPFKDAIIKNPDGTVTIKCPLVNGYRYHVSGWSWFKRDINLQTKGNTFVYKTTTIVYAGCRKVN